MAYTTIKKPSSYFNTKLYTGNSTTLSVTGVGFQPDWTWIKDRTSVGDDHALYDAVRGATKRIRSNQTDAENTQSTGLTSFDSDGFTVGTNGASNGNGDTFVSWNWLASNTTASNTDGSITSTVSANTTSGFSIVSYTGTGANATVGHGLGSAPAFIIFKDRSTTKDWFVYHQSISPSTGGKLNLQVNPGADIGYFNNTAPTSNVFSIGNANTTNPSGNNMIAYCFSEIKGFSKFGKYTSNANVNGPFTYTGFKPAFVMIKSTSLNEGWFMYDTKRSTYNVVENFVFADSSSAEQTSTANSVDILSNGFKIRTTDSRLNSSGSYIYMAFAEEPLVGDNPATAR